MVSNGSMGSYLRCLGRFRGLKGVNLDSYLRCLGRFRGLKGVVLSFSYFKRSYAFEGDWARLYAFGRGALLVF